MTGPLRAATLLLGLSLLLACAHAPASAEARGRWRFTSDDRPVKAVVLGGSISAYRFGSYGQYLQAVCGRVEIVNRAKSRLGATALRDRFEAQVLRNRRVDAADFESLWLIFFGGLNSVGAPSRTNLRIAEIMSAAHEAKIHTIALSLAPWGSERDRRWAGARGLKTLENTERVVDFVLGRSTPAEALGRFAKGQKVWRPGELPEIAVDLWTSPLRDAEAPSRTRPAIARRVRRSAWVKRRLTGLEGAARGEALEALIDRAVALPKTFMRPELRGFDPIHPRTEGHRVIAQAVCPKLPASWGCECGALDRARWDRRHRRVIFDDAAIPANP